MILAAAERYIAFCEAMTPADLDRLESFCDPDLRFCDPFNDVTGLAAYRQVLAKMFADVGQPDFAVTGRAVDGDRAYLRWRFTARGPGRGALRIEGMSEICFSAAGLVVSHCDFWDAGLVYEKIPLLRGLLRLVKRRLSVG